ncbi:DUF4446 family protein [Nonomuraea sp. 3-1Str]|uniref:DUF4446 family protein n=1 Tax=Nonomuraea sp. 3-1Str TaxID=2929801 RepID=UPI00285CF91E|nr:DUF4446 family protein [Nonomuraea sp. 3-1Str]MDR8407881.1 DUF4446 family protein [Nonomuraea sp. 3-1Str]
MLIAVGMCAAAATGGVVMGYLALRRAREEIEDCRRMLVRQASAARGDLMAIRDVAVCRYDALEKMAGELSFSVAMINGLGDGIVLTSINGCSDSRTYVRRVVGGRGEQPLSPEEEQAVRAARLGLGSVAAKPRAPRQAADTL